MGKINIFYIFILISILSCIDNYDKKYQQLINEVRAEYAPDRRTTVFNIDIIRQDPLTLGGETNIQNAKIALIKAFENANLEVVDKIIVLPTPDIGENKFALINVSVANLRGFPRHGAELVTQTLLGTPIHVLKEKNGWYLVQTPDKYIAWTNSGSLELMDQNQFESWKNAKKVIYINTYGHAMHRDGKQRIADLVAGNVLKLESQVENFWEVVYPDGRQARIAKDEAEQLSTWNQSITLSTESITAEAKQLTGIPYLWGGTSTKGLDCSGFTKTVYFLHGLIIPRDASQQVHTGILVDTEKDFSKLQSGDLLFFGSLGDDEVEKIVHVGLWLGDNEFIHASGDVHISSMDSLDENFDEYNYNRYLRTKRIIGANTIGIEKVTEFYQ